MNPILETKRVATYLFVLVACLPLKSFARKSWPSHQCTKLQKPSTIYSPTGATSGYSGTGSNINVVYQRCNWTINPDASTKTISGVVTVKFLTMQNFVSSITLDLNKASFENSNLVVKYHGNTVSKSFPSTGTNLNILTIVLPLSLPINTIDSIEITYSGIPPAVNGQAEGYQKKVDGVGNNYVYTLSESFEDRDWWPCKADMQDRIDSMDINVTVPDGFRVATNGKFIDSSAMAGSMRTFKYKLKYSIPSYLVALGIAKYKIYDRGFVNINGTNVPVWYFLFPGKTSATYTSILNALDHSKSELVAFSNVWGDYPFKNEKHGYYEFGWGGGMEHQSFSAMGASALQSWGTIAHELGHQWFGDKVTFATWNHLWLAEGFARYSEILAAELVPGLNQSALNTRTGIRNTARSTTYRSYGAYVPNAQIASSNALWSSQYGTTVYERGAMVVSSLRALLGDEKFFLACRNYLNDPDLQYGSATTEDLNAHFSAVAGCDLSEFFNDWVYGSGYPTYSLQYGYNATTKRLNIKVTSQTRTATTNPYMSTPVVLRVANATRDTTIVIYDIDGNQLAYAGNGVNRVVDGGVIGFNVSFTPTSITYDPSLLTMASGTVAALASLPVDIISFTATKISSHNKLSLRLSDASTFSNVLLEKSADGQSFYFCGLMNLSSSPHIKTFEGIDKNVVDITTYYRVKITDIDGTIRYSQTIRVTNEYASEDIAIVPTVAKSTIKVVVPVKEGNSYYSLHIIATNGSVVKSINLVKSGSALPINVSGLHNGVYWLKVDDGKNFSSVKKFTILK